MNVLGQAAFVSIMFFQPITIRREKAYIINMFTDPQSRRHGIGRKIPGMLLEEALEIVDPKFFCPKRDFLFALKLDLVWASIMASETRKEFMTNGRDLYFQEDREEVSSL